VTLRRATGEAAFAADFTRPETLHLAIRRSPLAHGRVVAADTTDARALAGVVTALTAEEAGGLLDPVLRFVGDRAAVVAAEDPEIARRAAEMIHLVVKPLPVSLDAEAASRDPDRVAARLDIRLGDADAALAEAEHVSEGTWTFPFSPAVALEPPVALTWLDEDRRLVVRTSAESPFRVRGLLAERLGLPAARIRVVRPLVAGGGGGRSDVPIEDLCGLVTLRTGRPARLALTAEEELTITPGHPPQRVDVRLGLRDGRVSGLALRLLVDLGGGTEGAEELLRSAGRQAAALYGAASLRYDAVAVRTHRPPTSASHGADDTAAFALECAVAEAAARLGEDGVSLRDRLLRRPTVGRKALGDLGEALHEAPGGDDTVPIAELLRTGAEKVGSKERRPERTPMDPVQRGLGVGLARRSAGTVGGTGAAASLRLLEDGSFALAAAPSAAGGADETVFAAAAADSLGIPRRRVVLAAADTDSAPFEAGELAPAFFAAGRAVEAAAELARERIRAAGAALLEVEPEMVELVAGEARAPDGRRVSFARIGASALQAGQPLVATAAPSAGSTPPSDAAVFAEVEVDTETGVVRPVRLTAVVAGGPFADPRPAEAQVEGALAAAVERALAAGQPFDADGIPLARSLRSWPFVAAGDVPPISVVFVPSGDPPTRFGAVAVGEAAERAALAAIAGAVADATRGTVRSLPLDPGTVLGLSTDR
jgi:putative selenate reductase molybdopterin-binding subunit